MAQITSERRTWLALMIGNSQLHWACFVGEALQRVWDAPHLSANPEAPLRNSLPLEFPHERISEVWIASVVPTQTQVWRAYPAAHLIALEQVPLTGTYPTLGIDRALAVWGAGETLGWPVLVIDAGTALTLTGADANRNLVGGAILPGVGLQLYSLGRRTAALPEVPLPQAGMLPQRWALNTATAMQSGVLYTLAAGLEDAITDWWQYYPESAIALTGGDHRLLHSLLKARSPELASRIKVDPHLIFWGMRACYLAQRGNH